MEYINNIKDMIITESQFTDKLLQESHKLHCY